MDNYETIRKLGQGTYGSVFLCRQKSSGRQCVMKRMQLNSLNDKERHAALQEAQLLQQLKHPKGTIHHHSITRDNKSLHRKQNLNFDFETA